MNVPCKVDFTRKIAYGRLLRRRSKHVTSIVNKFPNIGQEIERFVKDCGVGADAWRRTGILTFDGNCKVGKKVTFSRVKEHLEKTYKRKFAYGTGVHQLCVSHTIDVENRHKIIKESLISPAGEPGKGFHCAIIQMLIGCQLSTKF